ncbi:hypothetical protein Zmor_016108 [Zophobas morio]|uniref:Uncharacterized protein n=1 Tax=Zophobas morio TaxID=2755281 RepID=A0AA38IL20_9CUCU|nr:hypothetical protein Zmor_016108 [Zophobas morio]
MLSKVSVPIMCKNDNTLAANEHQSANLLADFFQSVFTSEPHTNLPPCLSPHKELFLSNIDFTEELVLAELIKISEKSSPGPDGLSPLILKKCASWIAGPLSHIMTLSFQNSVLPPIWLQALITLVWSPSLIGNKELLEKVQRRYLKTVQTLKDKPYDVRLSLLKLPSLEKRRIINDLVCTYNILTHQFGIDLSNIFELSAASHLRGHSMKLHHQKYKTRWRQNFLSNRVFNVWNSLDSDLIESSSTASFKNKLYNHLTDL